MANIGELVWKIKGDTKDIDKSLKSTDTKMAKFGKAVKAAFAAGAVIAFGKAAFDLGRKLVGVASNAEETAQKFGVVFDGLNNASEAAANLADNYGLSNQASQDLLSSTADLLQGFGVAKDESLDLSLKTQQLAVDLASFSNFAGGAKGASEALTKALLGERESVKALGIAITETELKRFAEEQGQVYAEMTKGEKAVLTLDLAIQQSANSIGDFERSQASFANQTRIAEASIEDLSASLGQQLLPASTAVVTKFNEMIGTLNDTREQFLGLKDSINAVNDGEATIDQQLQVLIARQERYTSATRKQKEALQEEIDTLEAIIERRDANIKRSGIQSELDLKAAEDALLASQKAERQRVEAAEREKEAALVIAGARQSLFDQEVENLEFIKELRGENALALAESETLALDQEQARHDARMQHLLDELDAASSYAGDAGQIFGNLIKIQMAGDDELSDSKKKNIIGLYRIQQAANIAQIGINTATAVVKALADLGPIAGAIAAGFIVGIGATQAAVVAATPPPVALADGGIVPARPGGTPTILGEAGQAEAVIPLDSAGVGGGGDTVLMIDGEILARWTQSQINNRAIVVPEGSMV